ncbi:ankyrin repeat domain-containing protein 31 [Antechinus flavipes]|uniref:ankyrin repeat domain-containing protein 31 n=1 Tax=Antechinus flavipes TaxID=38775 RepID=UPI0022364E75|nr:ankyrin repeat domain-containing protein 31 [Antechinus flavipes]
MSHKTHPFSDIGFRLFHEQDFTSQLQVRNAQDPKVGENSKRRPHRAPPYFASSLPDLCASARFYQSSARERPFDLASSHVLLPIPHPHRSPCASGAAQLASAPFLLPHPPLHREPTCTHTPSRALIPASSQSPLPPLEEPRVSTRLFFPPAPHSRKLRSGWVLSVPGPRQGARVSPRPSFLRPRPSSTPQSSIQGALDGCPRGYLLLRDLKGNKREKGGITEAGMEEESARGLDWDSDETVVEGSVTESEREDEELPLKRGVYGEASSPEIHLVYKLKEYLQEQMNKHMINPFSCFQSHKYQSLHPAQETFTRSGEEVEIFWIVTTIFKEGDEMDYPLFIEEGPKDDQVQDSEWKNEHNYSAGFDVEDLGFLQRPEKELSVGVDSPETSLLSGAVTTSYNAVEVKKKSSEKLEGSSMLSHFLKEVALPSREIREDCSCEMLVPTIEDTLGFSESILGEYPFIVNEFETKELLKPLSDLGSPKSMSPLDHLLICQEDGLTEDMQENDKNDALPAELLTALNTLSESMVESICQRVERDSRPCAEDECLETEPSISQTDDDCTQIAGMNFEFQHSVQTFGQGPKLTEPLFKNITMQQDKEYTSSFGQETLAHQNVACFDALSKEGNLNTMENNTETSYMLRRSARLKTVRAETTSKNIDEAYKVPEEILQKTDSILPIEYFRTQDSAFQNTSDDKSVEWSKNQFLSAYSCDDEEIIKSRRTTKNRKNHRNISKLSSINRRDIYGESPLHKAAQGDDSTLVKKYIKLGGNINLPDYAGWTALHEASVNGFYKTVLELLKGGADVNCKGMKQITPIYDAVLNGHYKVAELLLQNGADPLFRNDYGKCALDEASDDAHMKQLLERYIHKSETCPIAEKSDMLTNSVTPMLKNHLCHSSEIFSVSKGTGACENDTTSLTLMSQELLGQSTGSVDNQKEPDILESETSEPAEAISLSGFCSCEETKLPLATEGNDHTTYEKPVPCKVGDNNSPSLNSKNVTVWEKSFLSFLHKNVDSDSDNNDVGDDGCYFEETSLSEKMNCFVNDENQNNCKANSEHEKESSSQHYLPSETQSLLQDNVFQAGSLTVISQQDFINLSDSDCTIISERYVINDEQNIKIIISDVDSEQNPLVNTETPSTPDLSGQISGWGISASLHNNTTTAPSYFVNQIDEKRETSGRGEESSERTCTERTQENHQKSTECTESSCEKEAVEMEVKQPELPENDVILKKKIQSTKNMHEDLRDASQLKQGIEKTILFQSDKDKTDNVNKEQNTEKSHKETREKSPDTHVPRNLQLCEKSVQIKRKRQDFEETTDDQNLNSSIICKRNAKGKSRLHLAAKRGDLSLVKALIESGAHLNQKDNAGWTALHEAANKGFNEVMVELLKAGANVNSESLDGLLPIHNAVSGNHLKAAELLLQHGANPNQKDGDQKSALDRAKDEKMKKLLKSWNGNETRDICHNKVTGMLSKRQKQESCCKSKSAGPLSFSHQDSTKEGVPMHDSLHTILQEIGEKQESLLLFEIRTPKDADQYSEKMLQIKDIMDSVLAKQKKERDDLAKKYRSSIESFRQGSLREKLANLATRQKNLLIVAQKQKKLSQKIQNYKNTRNTSGLGARQESPDLRNSNENDEGSYSIPGEKATQPDSISVPLRFPSSPTSGSSQRTHCTRRQEDNQNLGSCMSESWVHEKTAESECFSFNELITNERPGNYTLERKSKGSYIHGIEMVKLPPQYVTSSAQAKYLQEENYTAVITAKGSKSLNPSAITETLNVLETTSATVRNNTHQPNTVYQPAFTSSLLPGNMSKKTVSQDPPRTVSESLVRSFLAHQENACADNGALLRMKPNHTESRPVGTLADNSQINFSLESSNQNNKQEPLHCRAEMKMKKTQIKELISLGRIKPGNDVLEFKMQDATYKASILQNGKIKAKNGEIYQNPITWIKALLGSNISVTWKYVWNKVTYLGKELCKYITEEVPIITEPNVVLQENQPCLSGRSSDSVQNFKHYLQLNEILLISNQEFLPCHIMEQHWKFYMASENGLF